MLSFSECKDKIESEICKIPFQSFKPDELYQPVAYILSLGGKRIRPVLTLMACELFSGKTEVALNPALAVEIFHNFTLLHDDIMDKAPMRRNHPTVHHKWNENIAILSGDAMNIIAYQYLCRTKTDLIPELIDVFSKVALEICEGQQFDMNYESQPEVSLPQYLKMIELKTAVLLAASLRIGAICGHAPEAEKQNIAAFGLNLGMAFQIQDDILDAFGNEKEFGKSIGGDILAGKKTFLYLKALEMAKDHQKQELSRIYNDKALLPETKIVKVLGIFQELNIQSMAEGVVTQYTEMAMKSLQAVNTDKSKGELEKLAYKIMNRKA
jgi:geranylgeranyl diphosphate synthase type II